MLPFLPAFRSSYGGYILPARFRRSTVFLSSPTFTGRDYTPRATPPHVQFNSTASYTVHAAEAQHHGENILTPHEREHIRKLLQQGFQARETFELACTTRARTPLETFVAMIEEDRELASLVREEKPKEWSDKEKEHLAKLIHRRRRIDIERIACQIGRKPKAVKSQLRSMAREKGVELGNNALSFPEAILNRNLEREEESVLEARMCHVIDSLLKDHDTTTQWRDTLRAQSTEIWATTILSFIPTQVKHMMAAPSPPTAADWRSLAWQDTSSFGVYAWVLKPSSSASLNPIRVENHVYIGSATKYDHGLAGRFLQHRKGKDAESGLRLRDRIKRWGLSRRTGHFATLLVMDPVSPESEDIIKARELVVFAEAILTVWFGALTETGGTDRTNQHRRFHSLSPWGRPWDHPQQFKYKGLCTHSPLSLDLVLPGTAQLPKHTGLDQSGPAVDNGYQGYEV
ncbi:hypothetical protein B0J18DRAFT_481739 [Chaetomium sp. MPI-SDFR-AT-0129]|nr:hypothetical protein B0J18DRAFT_481739 [Chaetomium sp. MPI-SDFR-AT-0129]